MKARITSSLSILFLLLGMVAATAAEPFFGAIQTTDSTGTIVNLNNPADCDAVYLTGGPQNQQARGLPDGEYYFQVTDPSGNILLSTDPAECRMVYVVNGRIAGVVPSDCSHALGTYNPANGTQPVHLAPFDPSLNPGGVHKVWLIQAECAEIDAEDPRVLHFQNRCAKTDTFRCGQGAPPPDGCTLVCPEPDYISTCADPEECVAEIDGLAEPTTTGDCTGWTIEYERSDDTEEEKKNLHDPYPIGTTTIHWYLKNPEGHIEQTCTQVIEVKDCTLLIECPEDLERCLETAEGTEIDLSEFEYTLSRRCSDITEAELEEIDLKIEVKFPGQTEFEEVEGLVTFPLGTSIVRATVSEGEGDDQLTAECEWTVTITGAVIEVIKFFDLNQNGEKGDQEDGLSGWKIELSGPVSRCAVTDDEGKVVFEDLPFGSYTITETIKYGWTATGGATRQVEIDDCEEPYEVHIGNVCTRGGGMTLGFWSNRNGERAFKGCGTEAGNIALLNTYCLKGADGNPITLTSYSGFRSWILGANATDLRYMLSAQLAAMVLNANLRSCTDLTRHGGGVDPVSLIYEACLQTHGYSSDGLISISDLLAAAQDALCNNETDRSKLECLKNALDRANNNVNFSLNCPTTPDYCPISF
jgi:hypothetical protein